jgi:dihydroorotate dehydrogenase (fumarate)
MTSLQTTWLGLKLRNPLVVSSSSLTDSAEKLKKLQESGAGAVVLKSLFEEQLELDAQRIQETLAQTQNVSAESLTFFKDIDFEVSPRDYLKLVETGKHAVNIPVVASLNCRHKGSWGPYARQIESAGADALELNIYDIPADPEKTGAQVEAEYLDAVSEARAAVKLPLNVKLSPFFSSLPHVVREIARRGANGVSLFNRFYQPNLDLENLEVASRLSLSRSEDALLPMRWIALLFGRVPNLEFSATGGVHDGKTALKMIAAGARVAMVCSALFKNKERHLGEMLGEMEGWLKEKEYASVDDLRGALSQAKSPDPASFERAQYIRMLVGFE